MLVTLLKKHQSLKCWLVRFLNDLRNLEQIEITKVQEIIGLENKLVS